jgi:Protein of unknown function (DUF2971)
MILYKYRSLANFERILDIILNQRLYCSARSELNDPFEGIYRVIYFQLEGKDISTKQDYKHIKDLGGSEIKICSLSSSLGDVRLWAYYADGHKGIVFAIDFPELEILSGSKIIYKVTYDEKLPRGSASPLRQISPQEALSNKTKHWDFESEYRIIDESKHLSEGKYFDIRGRIKAIYLGTRTSDIHRELLKKIIPNGISIYTTKINEEKIIVESDKLIKDGNMSP